MLGSTERRMVSRRSYATRQCSTCHATMEDRLGEVDGRRTWHRAPARSGHAALSHGHSTHGGGVCGRHQDKVYRGATAEEAREGWSWGESVLRVMLLCVDGWLPVNTHRPRSLLYDGVSRRPVPLWWVLLASVMYHLSYASSRSSSCPLYQCSSVREQRERRYRLRHRVVNRSGRARCALFEEIFRYRSLTHRPLARRSKICAPTRAPPGRRSRSWLHQRPF
jgi:hypothetical protein